MDNAPEENATLEGVYAKYAQYFHLGKITSKQR